MARPGATRPTARSRAGKVGSGPQEGFGAAHTKGQTASALLAGGADQQSIALIIKVTSSSRGPRRPPARADVCVMPRSELPPANGQRLMPAAGQAGKRGMYRKLMRSNCMKKPSPCVAPEHHPHFVRPGGEAGNDRGGSIAAGAAAWPPTAETTAVPCPSEQRHHRRPSSLFFPCASPLVQAPCRGVRRVRRFHHAGLFGRVRVACHVRPMCGEQDPPAQSAAHGGCRSNGMMLLISGKSPSGPINYPARARWSRQFWSMRNAERAGPPSWVGNARAVGTAAACPRSSFGQNRRPTRLPWAGRGSK